MIEENHLTLVRTHPQHSAIFNSMSSICYPDMGMCQNFGVEEKLGCIHRCSSRHTSYVGQSTKFSDAQQQLQK